VKWVEAVRPSLAGRLAQPLVQPRKSTMASQRRSLAHARPEEKAFGAELLLSIGATTVVAALITRGCGWSAVAASE
jgi:hypothetical protein